MRILIIEDNVRLALGLKDMLVQNNYAVDVFHDGEEGLDILDYQDYDLLLLDLGLPNIDGIEILKTLRKNNNNLPIIIISARFELDQRILGLEMGADDYIPKPFDKSEVLAKVRALIRRTLQNGQTTIELGNLVFNTTTRELNQNGKRIHLSKKELGIFEYLISQSDVVVSKEDISEHIGNFDNQFSSNAIETHVSRLRKKLGNNVCIKTFSGLGYMIHAK